MDRSEPDDTIDLELDCSRALRENLGSLGGAP
jgi:hypothetical protein